MRKAAIGFLFLLLACSQEEPVREDTPELITRVTLTFTATGFPPVAVTATDPDGEGIQDITADGPITIAASTTYVMSIQLINALLAPGEPGYDQTGEIEEEGQEHQFFFEWTVGAFSDPSGDGNLDHGGDPVNYTGASNSKDVGGLNLGLTTTWTTAASSSTGSFRIVLKHQPGTKTPTSDATVGETDLDLSFILNIN